ncbi:MAG TPA: membrane protein insertase YidC, partial [Anaeromyxobacteraceae bacterium]|nr:membrane protein insertase YidC [Anaeromyxobacteraceae bacterium]
PAPEKAAPAPAPAAPPPSAPEELAVLETADLKATFSTWGGSLKELELKGHKYRRVKDGHDDPVRLVAVADGDPWPLSLVPSSELGGGADLATDPAARTPMRLVSRDQRSVVFDGRVAGVGVRKRFVLADRPFEIDAEISIIGAERPGSVALLVPGFMPPDAPKPGFFSGGEVFESVTPVCRAGSKTERYGHKEAVERVPGTASWAGLDQHYFASLLIPREPAGECSFVRGQKAGSAWSVWRVPVPQGSSAVSFEVFAGPKQLDLLRSYGRDLDTVIDYGAVTNLFAFIARLLFWLMRWFHGLVHNWGVAIMLLTLTVRLALYPLTVKQLHSMQKMKELQPEIEKIKAKFGDDKEKMNQAVMQLYQEKKVNPASGCLPILIQMPIWFALYATLQTSVELYREPFLWIQDLTRYDPIYALPLAMGATMFATQKLAPQPADATQAKILLWFMPGFFTFLMLRLPAGLALYILFNNLLSILQQQYMMKKTAPPARPAKA